MNGFNNLGAQMLYNPPTIEDPPNERVVYKGYTKEQVQKIAKDAADKTAASWKDCVYFQRIQKIARNKAIYAIQRDEIDKNDTEAIKNYLRQKEREIAIDEFNLDFDELKKRFG